jgi:hypothetical protein
MALYHVYETLVMLGRQAVCEPSGLSWDAQTRVRRAAAGKEAIVAGMAPEDCQAEILHFAV